MLTFGLQLHHWNYFLALEKDLKNISRYIEFSKDNEETYSIELSHILLSASSEVDVVMKLLCEQIDSSAPRENINNYRDIIQWKLPSFIDEKVSIPRFNIEFTPWENWANNSNTNPNWWTSYNHIKHERNLYFREANLKNTINCVSALFLTVIYYYKFFYSQQHGNLDIPTVMVHLTPRASFLQTSYRLVDWNYPFQ
jgi:hypothetical protein